MLTAEKSLERHCMDDMLVTKGWGYAVAQLVEVEFDSRWCH